MNNDKVLLEASGLSKSFFKGSTEVQVLKNLSFKLHAAERVAITGASGAGKSTLLHVLGTLEKPTQGQVRFSGNSGETMKDVFSWNDQELAKFRNRTMGFVFQFHYLLPEFSALENVMLPALIAGHDAKTAEKQAQQLLEFVGLSHRLQHRPSELSGGEQQRVAISRAILLRPQVLFADELTGNLDSVNTNAVMDLLIQLNETMGVSILMVTHDLALTKKMHRVLLMKDGQFV